MAGPFDFGALQSGELFGWPKPQAKCQTIFVSYHHGGDQAYYDTFLRTFSELYNVVCDNSVDRVIDSENVAYVRRRLADNFITGSSCTIVLVGAQTWSRKYVDWEIDVTLNKGHGLIGAFLPSAPLLEDGTVSVPDRLYD